MFNRIKHLALAAALGVTGLAAAPAMAQADGLYLQIGGDYSRHGYHRGDRDRDRFRHGAYARGCSVDRALDKAERMGLRRVWVRDVSRHSVTVGGRKHGRQAVVRFARDFGCPVIRY